MVPIVAAALLAGCSSGDGTKTVTREKYEADGNQWPLSSDEVTIRCDGNALSVVIDGNEYALNGFARQNGVPQAVGVDVGAIQEVAMEVC